MFESQEFDAPIFKVLANNDTGAAPGHQGGIVIPADLGPYFPRLTGTPTQESPTLEEEVTLELWIGSICVGVTQSRYQYQTWGGERSPERRLTKGFSEWRNEARRGDVAVFQRSVTDEHYYRLFLVKQEAIPDELSAALARAAPKRWGLVNENWEPASNTEIDEYEATLMAAEPETLTIFSERERQEASSTRAKRSHAFRSAVLRAYGSRCVVTGEAIIAPSGSSSCDAAHIIPVEANGADVVQNGIALRKDLHWAFDRGLWSITVDGRVLISERISLAENPVLSEIEGTLLNLPQAPRWRPASEAVNWHRENRLLR